MARQIKVVERFRNWRRWLLSSKLIVTVFMFALSWLVSKYWLSDVFQPLGYAAIVSVSGHNKQSYAYPVRIVDITDLVDQNGTAKVTPASAIKDLLDQLSKNLDPPPKVVGLDVDMGPVEVAVPPTDESAQGQNNVVNRDLARIDPEHYSVMSDVDKHPRRFQVILGVDRLGVDPGAALIPAGSDPEEMRLSRKLRNSIGFLETFSHPLVAPVFVERRPGDERMYSLGARVATALVGNTGAELNIVQAELKDEIESETSLPPGWQRQFAFLDYSLLESWEDLVYRALATKGHTDDTGRTNWGLELPPSVMKGLQDSLAPLRQSNTPYAILIGRANAIHRSASDQAVMTSLHFETHGPPSEADDDYFMGLADPWHIPLRGSLFPGIAIHAALIDTIVGSHTVRMNAIGGFIIDMLLIAVTALGMKLLRLERQPEGEQLADMGQTKGVEGALWKQRGFRLALMLLVFGLAWFLRSVGFYWEGWIVVDLFIAADVLVGEPLEEVLETHKRRLRTTARPAKT